MIDLRRNKVDFCKLKNIFADNVEDKDNIDEEDNNSENNNDINKENNEDKKNSNEESDEDLDKESDEDLDEESDDKEEDKIDKETEEDVDKAENGMTDLRNITMYENTFKNMGNEGRKILKSLEKFKFSLEQGSRMVSQIPQLSSGLMSKRKSIDEISNKLYQLVFDLENTDISNSFQQENPFAEREIGREPRKIDKEGPEHGRFNSPSGSPGGMIPPNPNLSNSPSSKSNDDENEE